MRCLPVSLAKISSPELAQFLEASRFLRDDYGSDPSDSNERGLPRQAGTAVLSEAPR
ncbi:hypothetical protein HMPREF0580_1194 [Mobiluncus mulieris ATCC 35239]|uniref:Uncharacterized protein n=1 Tax=Mobiluncus mulieris ATCC 35239 TaxID=871571 RepID=E0QQM9_9ACTO|nr:hypothetical protein [Mobiluncus mulieris]EFM46131.1 hypothetical protein HMPREF0580_1194 [Mobiluncus mulieris ATCC 35239]